MALIEVQLRGNNLYSNGRIITFRNNESLLIRDRLNITDDLIQEYHVLRESEDLTSLAYQKYGKAVTDPSKYWWVIADANESIVNPLDLSDVVGTRLAIPDVRKILLLTQ